MTANSTPSAPDPGVTDPGVLRRLRRYGLDIETDTTLDGLDPACAPVVAVAVSTDQEDEVLTGDEATVLSRLDRLLWELPAGILVTWNGASFDLPFLGHRAELLGLPLGLRLWSPSSAPARPDHTDEPLPRSEDIWPPPAGGYRASWWGHVHLDGYRLYCSDVRRTLGLSCGLKAMARLVGLEPVEVDRSRVHRLSASELHRYVASDARLARSVVERRMPVAARFVDRAALPVSPHLDPLQR